jgi:hypothetical protein
MISPCQADKSSPGALGGKVKNRNSGLVLEAANFEAADRVGPQPLDNSRVVVALRQVVVEGREAVAVARVLHLLKLLLVELRRVDVAPIAGRGIHGKAGLSFPFGD